MGKKTGGYEPCGPSMARLGASAWREEGRQWEQRRVARVAAGGRSPSGLAARIKGEEGLIPC